MLPGQCLAGQQLAEQGSNATRAAVYVGCREWDPGNQYLAAPGDVESSAYELGLAVKYSVAM